MNKILVWLMFFCSLSAFSQKGKTIYKYKKYESFDFKALDVEGENNSPGDLSIGSRFKKKFKNKIPERKNFNKEIKNSVDSIL